MLTPTLHPTAIPVNAAATATNTILTRRLCSPRRTFMLALSTATTSWVQLCA